ncbi:MAG TPA: hypothetical protein VIH83_00945, partial [Candidatus Bathyarchaeia archaeon]
MVYLKQLMQNGQAHIPCDRELISELNLEQYEMMKTGQIRFDHPTGTHDDRLWAFALAVYASRPEVPEYRSAIVLGKSRRLTIGPKKGSSEEKFKTRREWQASRGQKATEGSMRMCIARDKAAPRYGILPILPEDVREIV